MRVLIEPNDVLMFRESKPFTAGETHLARSVFPLPQTIAGALRSAILIKSDFSDEACDLVGVVKKDGEIVETDPKFSILGCFPLVDDEYFLTPMDVAKAKDIDGYFLVKPLKLWNGFIFKGRSIHFKSVGGFISYSNLVRYLKDEVRDEELKNIVEFEVYSKESRIGIKLSNAKIAEEGFLYKAEFLRLNKISVWLGENSDKVRKFLNNTIVRLGGEGRFAKIEFDDNDPLKELRRAWDEIKSEINRNRKFKLYVATPMLKRVVKDNYIYNSGNIEYIKQEIEKELGVTVECIYHLIGKPIAFGGWNYAKNKPKPTRYAIPSGSVYFVEFDGKVELDEPFVKLGEMTKLGYGLCFLGVWV